VFRSVGYLHGALLFQTETEGFQGSCRHTHRFQNAGNGDAPFPFRPSPCVERRRPLCAGCSLESPRHVGLLQKKRGLPQLSSLLSRTIHLVVSLTTAHYTANRTRPPFSSLSYCG
jgi:hypothetical protein